MKLWSDSFPDGGIIPGEFAFGIPDPQDHVHLSSNRNPHLAWDGVPEGTRSLVLICHDPDVPSRGDDVNQEGREVPASLPRVDFFHWVLVDLPPTLREIAAGECSAAVTPRGKAGPATGNVRFGAARHGINDYTGWFAGDEQMKGDYFGYDGPCPPWNDTLPHHYVFTLYAVDIARLAVEGQLSGGEVRTALDGHVLARASLTGRYALNPDVSL